MPYAAPMDAVVVGSGPNGLAAAIVLARAGLEVRVLEAAETWGGGARTEALTLPGFVHDTCSAVHPLGFASPWFRRLPLERHGLDWVWADVDAAHPLDDGRCGAVVRGAGDEHPGWDGEAARFLARARPYLGDWDRLLAGLLGPAWPPSPPYLLTARFGLDALRSARGLAGTWFEGDVGRAIVAGMAAHSVLPLERAGTAAIALVLLLSAQKGGWPFPRGGSGRIADALVGCLREAGGTIECGRPVRSVGDLPEARVHLFDVVPRNLLAIAGERFPHRYRRTLARFRHGPGVFKIDWALSEPIPWRDEACRRAGTVHVGGTFDEVAEAEAAPWRGRCAERPFVLLAQPSVFDGTRAPAGRHVAWAYCHVPHGSEEDLTGAIERQVERFAKGFTDTILARATKTCAAMESWNANYVGGDISGGVSDLAQTFRRPRFGRRAYATPDPAIWLCSSSTPPGGGVHGMCGFEAAREVLREVFGRVPKA